jgi:hypothetical protein
MNKRQRKARAAIVAARSSNRTPREYKSANPLNAVPRVR